MKMNYQKLRDLYSNNIQLKYSNYHSENMLFFDVHSDYEYGQLAGNRYKNLYIFLLDKFKVDEYLKNKAISNKIDKIFFDLKKTYNFFALELEGLSKSINVSVRQLLCLHYLMFKALELGCTNTMSTRPATTDNQVFMTHNFDARYSSEIGLRIGYFILQFMWRRIFVNIPILKNIKKSYKYIYWGLPVIYEIPFLNEKGLGMGNTSIHLTHDKRRDIDTGDGVSSYLLQLMAMRNCTDVKETYNLWKDTKREMKYSKTYILTHFVRSGNFCDRTGNIGSIEYTHNHIKMITGESIKDIANIEGILWHTNHHIWLDPNVSGAVKYGEHFDANGSYKRAERALYLLKKKYGKIDVEVCKDITKDHGSKLNKKENNFTDGICRHIEIDKWSTIFAWIIQPEEYTVIWSKGNPCENEYIKYDFNDIF